MTTWMISANSYIYDHASSFKKHGFIDWRQHLNFEIGDIVYIYNSKPNKRIEYKTVVEKVNLSRSEIINDQSFWLDTEEFRAGFANNRFARLRLLAVTYNPELSYKNLCIHGLKGGPQKGKKLTGELLTYIESNFSQNSYTSFFSEKLEGSEEDEKNIISFPCGGTYNIVRKTLIHAHPVKRGFPSTIPEYLMVRGKGGISHELFKVITTFNFNPYDSAFIESIGDEPFRNRIQEYIYMRDEEFGFGQAPDPYRFYVLETVYTFDPHYVLENNTQGYRYLSFSQLGINENEILDSGLDLLEEELEKLEVTADEKLALIKTRINQSVFRERLLKRYNSCCLCDVSNPDFLTASHIKPWADSDNNERLDTDNGFLLCPNHDKLFDRGYITFNDDGSIIISKELDETDRIFLNVHKNMKVKLTEGNKRYLKYHRDNVFKK